MRLRGLTLPALVLALLPLLAASAPLAHQARPAGGGAVSPSTVSACCYSVCWHAAASFSGGRLERGLG